MSSATRSTGIPASKAEETHEKESDVVVVKIDGGHLTTALFAALQPTWVRVLGYVLPLVGAAYFLRTDPSATTPWVVGVAGILAARGARHLVAYRALRRAHPNGKIRVTLGPSAIVREGLSMGWEEVTDAAEIDMPVPGGDAIRVLAVRARGTWSVLTPVARFLRGDYQAARAAVNAARGGNVRVIMLR
jgi:hypothetical protein